MRTLLKLYPRRIRNRYSDELLDLENELRAQGEVSRTRLIRDMLAGALLIRPTRQRARLVTGAVLVIVGLAMAGTIIGGRGTDSPARASHPPTAFWETNGAVIAFVRAVARADGNTQTTDTLWVSRLREDLIVGVDVSRSLT